MEVELDNVYDVEVIKINPKGLIVKLSDNSTQLIHISRISNSYVRNLDDIFKIGDKFKAKGVAGFVRSVELSLVHLDLISPKHAMQAIHYSRCKESPKLSLDEMIDKCNKEFKDKTKHLRFNNRRNQNNEY